LALTRQNVPILEGTSAAGVAQGGYVLSDPEGDPEVVIIGTGSEVQFAVEAQKALKDKGIAARVVSMPCVEWFDEQPQGYRDAVLPPTVPRVSVEAGIAMPWYRIVGAGGEIVSLDHFGASADYKVLYEQFGITTEAVIAAAQRAVTT
ncbi:transketolase, partial [Streptomyces sp. SID10244]|nr:transketolase [Streptomyces sp. SID10244]